MKDVLKRLKRVVHTYDCTTSIPVPPEPTACRTALYAETVRRRCVVATSEHVGFVPMAFVGDGWLRNVGHRGRHVLLAGWKRHDSQRSGDLLPSAQPRRFVVKVTKVMCLDVYSQTR